MSSQIRNFIIAFVIAALVFSGIAVIAVEFIDTKILNPDSNDAADGDITLPAPPEETAVDTGDGVYHGSGKTFNFLLIGTDMVRTETDDYPDAILVPEDKNRAVTLIFAMFNKERNEFIVSPIPSQTVITVDGVEMNIGDAYHYKGEKYIADKVSGLLGIGVDYYMSVDIVQFGQFVDYVGGVSCDVPVDINFFDPLQNITIEVEKGKQSLDGSTVQGMIRYDGYSNPMNKYQFVTDVFIQVMQSITSDYLNKQQYATIYAYFTDNMKTNFNFDAMKANVELIFKFTTMSKTLVFYPGYWNDSGFIPEISNALEQYSVYKN